ncbi:arabinose efflux permease family protein [Frankia sp. EI5c]|uniref:MFS transporter n=1 Tax=Frankia sp. EI5c TaxID=683316 RepID=UPI0007C316CC|nr:MFS transporter [Frankia sp. EI5c]OAA29511.1 arabinose efflux permease family protein [Frankia sp. EI5c]
MPTASGQVGNDQLWDDPAARRRVLLTCLTAMFATTFTATLLTVSLRPVAKDLDSSVGVISWAVTGSLFALAVAMPILGRIGDIRGHRRTFLAGTTLAVVFSAATGLAWDATSLIAFRIIAQLAGSATIPASFAMLFNVFPPHERVRPSAWASGVLSGASVTGLAIGGVIIDAIGWRAVFFLQAGIAMVPLIAAIRVLPADHSARRASLDRAGAAVLAVAVFALTFGVNRAAAWGPEPIIIVLLAAVPGLFWLLVVVERRSTEPVLPLELLAKRGVRAAGLTSFLIAGAHMGNFLVTPLLLQGVFGLSVSLTSVVTMCRTLSIALAAPSASWLGTRLGPRLLASLAGCAYAASLLVLAYGTQADVLWLVIVGLIGSGLAFGHAQPPLIVIASNAVSDGSFGLVTSLQQTAGQIGGVVGTSLLAALVADALEPGPFTASYLIAAAFALLAAAAVLLSPRDSRAHATAAKTGSGAVPAPSLSSPLALADSPGIPVSDVPAPVEEAERPGQRPEHRR